MSFENIISRSVAKPGLVEFLPLRAKPACPPCCVTLGGLNRTRGCCRGQRKKSVHLSWSTKTLRINKMLSSFKTKTKKKERVFRVGNSKCMKDTGQQDGRQAFTNQQSANYALSKRNCSFVIVPDEIIWH